jgi:hypothetical protein
MTETQKQAIFELTLDSLLDQMYYMEDEDNGPTPPTTEELAELKEEISDAVQEVVNKFLSNR